MTNPPLVSIGVASYNNAPYIEELLESIRQQTHPAVELLVVDDASTDDSVAVIEDWVKASGHPVQLHRQPRNQGVVAAANELRQRARGEFFLLMGSDDWLLPDMVADTVAEFARRGPRCGAVYSDCRVVDAQGREISPSFLHHFDARFGPAYPEGNLRVPLLSGFYMPAATTVVRRGALEQAGPYDKELRAEDLDMWLRLSAHWEFAYLPKATAAYRVHGRSITASRKPHLNETFFQIYRKNHWTPGAERAAADRMLAEHAEHYYVARGRAAAAALIFAFRQTRRAKLLAFYAAAQLGVPHQQFMRWFARG